MARQTKAMKAAAEQRLAERLARFDPTTKYGLQLETTGADYGSTIHDTLGEAISEAKSWLIEQDDVLEVTIHVLDYTECAPNRWGEIEKYDQFFTPEWGVETIRWFTQAEVRAEYEAEAGW